MKERSGFYSIIAAYTLRDIHRLGDRISYSNRFNLEGLKRVVAVNRLSEQLDMAHFYPVTTHEQTFFDLLKVALAAPK